MSDNYLDITNLFSQDKGKLESQKKVQGKLISDYVTHVKTYVTL